MNIMHNKNEMNNESAQFLPLWLAEPPCPRGWRRSRWVDPPLAAADWVRSRGWAQQGGAARGSCSIEEGQNHSQVYSCFFFLKVQRPGQLMNGPLSKCCLNELKWKIREKSATKLLGYEYNAIFLRGGGGILSKTHNVCKISGLILKKLCLLKKTIWFFVCLFASFV